MALHPLSDVRASLDAGICGTPACNAVVPGYRRVGAETKPDLTPSPERTRRVAARNDGRTGGTS